MSGSLVDSSVWVASAFRRHPHHVVAQDELDRSTTAAPAAFCRATQQSFLRLVSTPQISRAYQPDPVTNRAALVAYETLLARPGIAYLDEPPGTVALWHRPRRARHRVSQGLDGRLPRRLRPFGQPEFRHAGSRFPDLRVAWTAAPPAHGAISPMTTDSIGSKVTSISGQRQNRGGGRCVPPCARITSPGSLLCLSWLPFGASSSFRRRL